MKAIIVYYSLTSNTEFVAKELSNKLDCDILPLEVLNPYPDKGFKKFYWGGKSAVMKESPELKKYTFNKDNYDVVILGTPVWAGTFTPPLRTFVKENDLSDKNVAIYACSSGGKAINAINKLKNEIGINSDILSLELVDPKNKYNDVVEKQINDFSEEIKKVFN